VLTNVLIRHFQRNPPTLPNKTSKDGIITNKIGIDQNKQHLSACLIMLEGKHEYMYLKSTRTHREIHASCYLSKTVVNCSGQM